MEAEGEVEGMWVQTKIIRGQSRQRDKQPSPQVESDEMYPESGILRRQRRIS